MQDVTTKHKLSADAVVAYNYAYATSEKNCRSVLCYLFCTVARERMKRTKNSEPRCEIIFLMKNNLANKFSLSLKTGLRSQ